MPSAWPTSFAFQIHSSSASSVIFICTPSTDLIKLLSHKGIKQHQETKKKTVSIHRSDQFPLKSNFQLKLLLQTPCRSFFCHYRLFKRPVEHRWMTEVVQGWVRGDCHWLFRSLAHNRSSSCCVTGGLRKSWSCSLQSPGGFDATSVQPGRISIWSAHQDYILFMLWHYSMLQNKLISAEQADVEMNQRLLSLNYYSINVLFLLFFLSVTVNKRSSINRSSDFIR